MLELPELALPSPLLIEAEALSRNFYAFVHAAWHIIEPGQPLVDNWHIGVICAHLQAITEGHISRLIINIPFRMTKSRLVSVLWPAWEWTRDPTLRYLTAAREEDLATRDAVASRRIIQSGWYQQRWGHLFYMTSDQNAKERYENSRFGYRIVTSVGSGGTGEGGDRRVVDDPHDMTQIFSDVKRKAALSWWDNTMSTRFIRSERDPVVLIMQRGHRKDLTGHLTERGGWEHIVLPMEFDGARRKSVLGFYDPRTRPNELLSPKRIDRPGVEALKVQLGSYGTAGQMQQTPVPVGGGIIKEHWLRLWPKGRELPVFSFIVQSYDTAFTTKTANDPTACGVFGVFQYQDKPQVMLLDAWHDRMAYPALRKRVKKDWRTRYGGAIAKGHPKHPADPGKRVDIILIEEKGSGISLRQDLAVQRLPVVAFNPGDNDKVTRLHACSPLIEAGVLWVPESRSRPGDIMTWAHPWRNELTGFGVEGTAEEHDDYVDVTTQALLYMRNAGMIHALLVDADDLRQDDEEESMREYRQIRGEVNPYAA